MSQTIRLLALIMLTVMCCSLVSACVKDTTFNPHAKPDHAELDKLQTTINDRPGLETAAQQVTSLDSQVRSVIAQISPQTVIGPSIPVPDRGCPDPFTHNVGDTYTIQQIAARPAPSTEQFRQIEDALAPILTAANFTSKTPASTASSTLDSGSPDGATISLINSAGVVMLYEYSTGCRLPAAWRTGPPPPDRRPSDDPNVHYPYLYGSPGGRSG